MSLSYMNKIEIFKKCSGFSNMLDSDFTGSSEANQISGEIAKQTPQRPDDGRGQTSSMSTRTSPINIWRKVTRRNFSLWCNKDISRFHLVSAVDLIRRCLMSSWMRTNWRTRVNTWLSTWKFTGALHICPALPPLTPYWTKV